MMQVIAAEPRKNASSGNGSCQSPNLQQAYNSHAWRLGSWTATFAVHFNRATFALPQKSHLSVASITGRRHAGSQATGCVSPAAASAAAISRSRQPSCVAGPASASCSAAPGSPGQSCEVDK